MRRLRKTLLWAGVATSVTCVLAVAAGWWALAWHASTVGGHLPARIAVQVARLGAHGRAAAASALISSADYDLRVRDPAWLAVIAQGLRGTAEERIRMLDLLRSAFDYGRGPRLRGADPPERELVFQLAAGPGADQDPAVQLAAHRCWWGVLREHARAKQWLATQATALDAIPASPITPDGWRPDPVARLVFWRQHLPGEQRQAAAFVPRLLAADDGDVRRVGDRRSRILAAGILLDERGESPAADQGCQRALAALFSPADWVADIWERDTTTACLLAGLLWDRSLRDGHPELQPLVESYLGGTVGWCLKQAPGRLPPWRADGREIPASRLDRFAAWLLATRMVCYAGTPHARNPLSPATIARAATASWPPTVDLAPDPQDTSPFALRLVMSLLTLECLTNDPAPPKAWSAWREAIQGWMLRRQILTFDHEGREGTWPMRGQVDATWETLFLGDDSCAGSFFFVGDDP